jgi:acyl-CoA reductase-like NAD-dependent aldehyde dehydrogenase
MTVDTSNLGKFYIAGQWVAPRSQANMPVLNPANERQIGIVPLGDAADVDEAAFTCGSSNSDNQYDWPFYLVRRLSMDAKILEAF